MRSQKCLQGSAELRPTTTATYSAISSHLIETFKYGVLLLTIDHLVKQLWSTSGMTCASFINTRSLTRR